MDFRRLSTEESGRKGRGADKRMILQSRVAARKDQREILGWALSRLSNPQARERVFRLKEDAFYPL